MEKKILLATVLAGSVAGNYVYGADVSNWGGLKANDTLLTLINNINDPAATATGNPVIKTNITQTISGGENKYAIDGTTGGIDGFINASTGANLTFKDLTVQNFQKARFLTANDDSEITVQNSTFQNNTYNSNGAALYYNGTGTLDLSNVIFKDNSNTSGGGAAYFGKGTLSMTGGSFTSNSANSGGALSMGEGKAAITNVTFENNTARNSGGAMSVGIGSVLEMDNVTFNNNTSTNSYAGALEIAGTFSSNAGKANNVTIKNSHFESNKTPEDDGGAIHMGDYSTLTVDNTKFYNNVGKYSGGAIMTGMNGVLTIKNSDFKGNHTSYDSGAVGVNGALEVYNSTFKENYSSKYGGAIWTAQHSDHSNIISSTFTNNYSNIGGAVWFEDRNVKVIDSTFKGNHADYGGAIYFQGGYHKDPAFNIIDTSFTENNYADEGGAIYLSARDLNIFADKKDVTFSGNIAHNDDFTDLANSYNGGGAIYFDGSNTLSLNVSAGKQIVFNDTIASYGDNAIEINKAGLTYSDKDGNEVQMGNSGEVQFNNYVGDGRGNIFTINLLGGTLSVGQNDTNNAAVANPDGYINFNNFNIKGDSVLNTVNNAIGEFAPKVFEIDSGVNWQYKFDVNLANAVSDKLVGANNNGTLTLALKDLNILEDATAEEVKIAYADTNVNGSLSGNTLTTSTATYEVKAENDATGSYLVFTKDAEEIGGLPGAIKNRADVYAITDGRDEVVNKWYTNVVSKDLVVNANGNGILAENNLDGIIIAEDKSLTMNDAKEFSGFNNAFVLNENATLTLNNTTLTGNTGVAILSEGGTVNLNGVVVDGDIKGENNAKMNITSDTIVTGSVTDMLTTQASGNVTVGNISGGTYTLNDGLLGITGSLKADTFTISGGTLDLTNGEYASLNTVLSGGNINAVNNKISNLPLGNTTLSGITNLNVDADLSSEKMDTVSASSLAYNGGSVNVSDINLIGQTNKSKVIIPFADDVLKAYVTTDVKQAMGEIYKYSVDYDKNTGNFVFTGGGSDYKNYNPAVMAGAVAAAAGGYLTQLQSYDEAFQSIEAPQSQWQKTGRYKRGWVRPYATSEHVRLKNGPKVTNKAYGSFFGVESELQSLGSGWKVKAGTYISYNHSRQEYDNVAVRQKGGMLGVVGMAYKDNLFTGLTVNIGGNEGKEKTAYGKEDFSMFTAGIASKTGYNIEQADGKLIIQPNILTSYSRIDTSNYTNAAGIKIKSDALNAFQLEPGVKVIGNLDNGYQPYTGVSMVWTLMDKTKFHANEAKLPELSVKPYAKYEIGVKRNWEDKMTGYVQCDFMSGGREGVSFQAGFSWALGK